MFRLLIQNLHPRSPSLSSPGIKGWGGGSELVILPPSPPRVFSDKVGVHPFDNIGGNVHIP